MSLVIFFPPQGWYMKQLHTEGCLIGLSRLVRLPVALRPIFHIIPSLTGDAGG